MAYFKVNQFNGIAPVVAPRLLADGVGQIAENVQLNSGRLKPLRDTSQVTTGFSSGVTALSNDTRTSIWRYTPESTDYWLQWNEDVDAVDGPLPKDSYDRAYFTGQDFPRVGSEASMISGTTYPAVSYRLGVKAPTLPSALTSSSGFTLAGTNLDTETPNTVAYVFTYVTGFGEEGPPSLATATKEVTDSITDGSNQTITFTLPAAISYSSGGNFTTGHKLRIYRSNTGSNTTAFQFVGESTSFGGSFTDSLDGDELGEVIPSTYWIGPPDDDSSTYPEGPMKGLTALPNGIFAGFAGRRLCFSEPYLPHAWPVSYRITTEDRIVAIAMAGNALLVTTEGNPYVVFGADPSSMQAIRLEAAYACTNKRSVVDMGDYAMYASPDGLVAVAANEVQLVTEQLIDPYDWANSYAPTTIQGFLHEGTYVGFYNTGTSDRAGFVFDPRRGKNAFTTLTVSSTEDPRGGYYDPQDGQLYLIDTTSTNRKIQKFEGNTSLKTLKWKSKKFVAPRPVGMSWVSVTAEAYPFTVSVWVDDSLIYVATVTESGGTKTLAVSTPSGISNSTIYETILRLPSAIGKEWEVQVESAKNINELCIAESIDEIRSV
tara:strand:+ start:1410 stop:3212 length:1803 start_codon:yes stop_codon:yes gene_type:complete